MAYKSVNSSGVGYIASTDAAKGGAAVLAFANDKKLKNKVKKLLLIIEQPVAQIKLSAGTLFSSCFRSVRLSAPCGLGNPLNDPSSLNPRTRPL